MTLKKTSTDYIGCEYDAQYNQWNLVRKYSGTSYVDAYSYFSVNIPEDITEFPLDIIIDKRMYSGTSYSVSLKPFGSTSSVASCNYIMTEGVQHIDLTGTIPAGKYTLEIKHQVGYIDNTGVGDFSVRFPVSNTSATCDSPEVLRSQCSRCGLVHEETGIAALGHDMQHNTTLRDFKVEFDRSKTYNYHDFEYVAETNSWRALPIYSGTSYSSENVYFNFSISENMTEVPIVFKPVGCASSITSTAVYLYSKSGTNYGYKTYYLYSGNSYKEQTLTWTGDFPAGDYYIYWSDYIDYNDRASQYAPKTEIQFLLSDYSPTCTEYGKDAYECSRCNLIEYRNDEEPLGHDYVSDEGLGAKIVSTTNSTYFFEYTDGVFKSNNQDRHSTTADTTIVVDISSDVEVPWSVSSETNYDRLTITVDGVAVVNSISGAQNGTVSLTAGEHTINLKYSKDGSASSGTDTATFSLPVSQSISSTHVTEGVRHLECSRCGDVKDEPIPKLPNYDLQLDMKVSGNMASLDKTVQFCIEMRDENGDVITHGFDIYDAHGADTGEDLTFDENGKAYITLGHSESVVIKDFYGNEPYNITYEDVGSDGYSVIVTSGSLHSDTGITMPTVLDVTFVKSVIIPSGIEVTIQPYMILMLFCCLIIGAAMIRKFKKKF